MTLKGWGSEKSAGSYSTPFSGKKNPNHCYNHDVSNKKLRFIEEKKFDLTLKELHYSSFLKSFCSFVHKLFADLANRNFTKVEKASITIFFTMFLFYSRS